LGSIPSESSENLNDRSGTTSAISSGMAQGRRARESNYWSRLGRTDTRWAKDLGPVAQETHEFVAMLTTAVKKLRNPIAQLPPA